MTTNLTNLQNSYLKSLQTITKSGGRKKKIVDVEKKDDELTSWKNTKSFDFTEEKERGKQMFPISRKEMFFSLLFWILLTVLVYLGITYGILYSRITMESDLKGPCGDSFSSKENNMQKVFNYTIGAAGPYLVRLRSSKKEDYAAESQTLPPIVTAVTSAHFFQVQGLISHIRQDLIATYPDLQLIVYDLGLYKKERMLLEKYGHCDVRDLRFEQFPAHVTDVTNFAWRPIILQHLLQEFGAVAYVDPTTRFKTSASLNYLRMRGQKNYYLWDSPIFTSLVAYTQTGMFTYFNESRCTFFDCSLLSSEAIVLYRTEETWTEVMKPWLKCALNAECIAPKYARYGGCFTVRHPRTTGCHRYDMSALSIILNRGVQYTINSEKMVSFRLTYTTEDLSGHSYFPEQPWTYFQIFLLLMTPVLVFLFYKYVFKRRRFR